MTPDRTSLLDEIRRKAMSDEGISDEQAADYQARQAALMQIAEKSGGPEAIRVAMKPRVRRPVRKAQPMPVVTREELVGAPRVVERPDPMIAANQAANAEVLSALRGLVPQVGESFNQPSPMSGAYAQANEGLSESGSGLVAKLLSLFGSNPPAPQRQWQGPVEVQGALPAAMNPGQRLMGR